MIPLSPPPPPPSICRSNNNKLSVAFFFDVGIGRPKSFDVAIGPTQTMSLPCFEFTIHYFFQDNQSALHLASVKGQSGVVKLLVESGAQLDIQNMVCYAMQ